MPGPEPGGGGLWQAGRLPTCPHQGFGGSHVVGRIVTPEAGDLGLGLAIRNIRRKDIPSAVHHGKIFYQRNLS